MKYTLATVFTVSCVLLTQQCNAEENTSSKDYTKYLTCTNVKKCSLIAEAIMYEARGESEYGREAVGVIIINRVKEKYKIVNERNIRKVINEKNQFSFITDKDRQSSPTYEDKLLSYKAATNVLLNESKVAFMLNGVKYYHSNKIKPPKWTNSMQYIVSIDNHLFYK